MTETTRAATEDDATQENATPHQGVTEMSTTHDTKKVPPRRDIESGEYDQRAFACTIMGIDGCGYIHVYDEDRNRVVVLDEDGIDETQDLDGYRTGHWLDYVEDERGWTRQDYFDLMHDVAEEVRG